MLNFDIDRYVSIQRGALASADALSAVVERELRQGLNAVIFAGAGGAGILMDPAGGLLAARSRLPTRRVIGGELVASGSALLSDQTLCVVPSLSGTTPDTLAQIEVMRAAGARVLALVGNGDTPIARAADYVVVNPAADDTSSESFYLQSHILAVILMHQRGEWEGASHYVDSLHDLPEALVEVKRKAEEHAEDWARHLADHDWHVVTSSGPSWTEAYYYAMCILEEMQWIRTRPVHAYDFFHGTLELVQHDTSVVILKGLGASRLMDERVESFVSRISDRMLVIDAAQFDLGSIPAEHLSQVVLAAALERVSAHLENLRDHPLTTRRYYRKVAY